MFRFTASSATSRAVPWLTGRCASCGSSQARAIMATICSGVNTPGQPARGASTRVSVMQRLTSDRQARCSTACKRSWAAAQRRRHRPTAPHIHPQVPGQIPVEPPSGRGQHDARPSGQTLRPRGTTNQPLQISCCRALSSRAGAIRMGLTYSFGVSYGEAVVGRKGNQGGQPLYSGGDSPCTRIINSYNCAAGH